MVSQNIGQFFGDLTLYQVLEETHMSISKEVVAIIGSGHELEAKLSVFLLDTDAAVLL